MKVKKNKTLVLFLFLIILLFLFPLIGLNSKYIRIQIHTVSEWITSNNLGFSSIYNITDDGSINYRGDYNQPIIYKLLSIIKQTPAIVSYKIKSLNNSKIKTLYIDINFENFEKILNDRQSMLNIGHGIFRNNKEVNADIWFVGSKKRAKVRLKGILDTHWLVKRRMSLKIKVLDDETILGFKEFSIQKPRERQWPYNYVFESLAERLDLLSSNSDLLNVVVNGEKWGIMLAEESLGKVYLENEKKKDSLIFKFGDERLWLEGWANDPYFLYRLADPSLFYNIYNPRQYLSQDYTSLLKKISKIQKRIIANNNKITKLKKEIGKFNKDNSFKDKINAEGKIKKIYIENINLNKELSKENRISSNNIFHRKMISYVLKNKLKYNSNLFDVEKMNMAYFLSNVWGRFHNLLNNNTSYYLNPYTLKLEPIVRDQYSFENLVKNEDIMQWPPEIQFLVSLQQIKSTINAFELLDSIEKQIPFIRDDFTKAKNLFPVDAYKDSSIISKNLKTIYDHSNVFIDFNISKYYKEIQNGIFLNNDQLDNLKLFGSNPPLPSINQIKRFSDLVYLRHYNNGDIEIFNLIPDNVIIKEIIYEGKNIIKEDLFLPSYLSGNNSIIIKSPLIGIQDGKLTIRSIYKDITSVVTNGISLIHNVQNHLEKETPVPNFIIKQNNEWKIPKGSWKIKDDLILSGNLTIEPGTHLKFSRGVSLVVNGSLNADGLPGSKIMFESLDESWGGIYVYNSHKNSSLNNVIIKNTKGINEELLNLSGGVVFYNSDVNLNYVTFDYSEAEDALNIVNSKYIMQNVKFINTRSDAFDSDFSEGTILDTKFSYIGGDAADFSGSLVKIKNVSAQNVKDKAFSIGEASKADINNVDFINVGVAIASKDGSMVNIADCVVVDFKLMAFMTYVKKKNYSTPTLIINRCKIERGLEHERLNGIDYIDPFYFRQKGTELTVDGNTNIAEQEINVDLLYETDVMKKIN